MFHLRGSEILKILQDPDRMTGFSPDVDLNALPRASFSLAIV